MSLHTAREHFTQTTLARGHGCNGCRRWIKEGTTVYRKEYKGKRGKSYFVVLHNLESCWEAWDYRFWSARGIKHAREDKTRPRGSRYIGSMINE